MSDAHYLFVDSANSRDQEEDDYYDLYSDTVPSSPMGETPELITIQEHLQHLDVGDGSVINAAACAYRKLQELKVVLQPRTGEYSRFQLRIMHSKFSCMTSNLQLTKYLIWCDSVLSTVGAQFLDLKVFDRIPYNSRLRLLQRSLRILMGHNLPCRRKYYFRSYKSKLLEKGEEERNLLANEKINDLLGIQPELGPLHVQKTWSPADFSRLYIPVTDEDVKYANHISRQMMPKAPPYICMHRPAGEAFIPSKTSPFYRVRLAHLLWTVFNGALGPLMEWRKLSATGQKRISGRASMEGDYWFDRDEEQADLADCPIRLLARIETWLTRDHVSELFSHGTVHGLDNEIIEPYPITFDGIIQDYGLEPLPQEEGTLHGEPVKSTPPDYSVGIGHDKMSCNITPVVVNTTSIMFETSMAAEHSVTSLDMIKEMFTNNVNILPYILDIIYGGKDFDFPSLWKFLKDNVWDDELSVPTAWSRATIPVDTLEKKFFPNNQLEVGNPKDESAFLDFSWDVLPKLLGYKLSSSILRMEYFRCISRCNGKKRLSAAEYAEFFSNPMYTCKSTSEEVMKLPPSYLRRR